MTRLILFLNLPRAICDHLIGERHTIVHRMICGALVMITGVAVAHTATLLPAGADLTADLLGYLIHGLGATPYVEAMVLAARNQ